MILPIKQYVSCLLVFLSVASLRLVGQSARQTLTKTKIVLLGTGAPAPDPDHSGPATAIVVNDTAYLVDLGPGVVRRASAAYARGITALEPTRLRVAFVTQLHSDHTLGYPKLIFTPWTIGRREPLEVYGPKGLKAMTEHLQEAYSVDIETRTNADGNQRDRPEEHVWSEIELVLFSLTIKFNFEERRCSRSSREDPTSNDLL